jgi:hypothetical protein
MWFSQANAILHTTCLLKIGDENYILLPSVDFRLLKNANSSCGRGWNHLQNRTLLAWSSGKRCCTITVQHSPYLRLCYTSRPGISAYTSGGRSVGIVPSRTKSTELVGVLGICCTAASTLPWLELNYYLSATNNLQMFASTSRSNLSTDFDFEFSINKLQNKFYRPWQHKYYHVLMTRHGV